MKIYPTKLVLFFLLPALLLISVFVIYPTIFTIVLSFLRGEPPRLTLENYMMMWRDPRFIQAAINSAKLLIVVPLAILTGLGFALLFHSKYVVGRSILRTLVMSSMILPPAIVGIVWLLALDPWAGIYNKMLQALGFPRIAYLYDPRTAIYALIFAITWGWTGFTMTTFIANLESIPKELYEAAQVDGASKLQMFFTITLPLLRPAFVINVVMTTLYVLKVFDIIYVLGAEAPPLHIAPLAYYMYYVMMYRYDMNYAAAIATFLTALTFLASVWYIRRLMR